MTKRSCRQAGCSAQAKSHKINEKVLVSSRASAQPLPILHRHPAGLTPYEWECLRWAAEGRTAEECANILGLPLELVQSYLKSSSCKPRAGSERRLSRRT